MSEHGITIVGAEVSNFRRLRVARVEMVPGKGLVRVTGETANGKTSLLKAIAATLFGAAEIHPDSIHQDAEKGQITLRLSNGYVAQRRITKAAPKDRPSLNRLFGAEVAGSRWLIATNGHIAIGERSERHAEGFEGESGHRVLIGTMTPTGEVVGEITRDALFEFAGEPEYRGLMQCSDCEGSGQHDCDCDYCDRGDCYHCKGDGQVEEAPAERPGWIGPHVFNLVYVAQVLAEAPEGMVRLTVDGWTEGQTDGGRLYLDGGEWRACIMGMRHRSRGGEFRDYTAAPRLALEVEA